MEKFWRISEFKDQVGKPLNTVDNWFKRLEKARVHYVNRTEHGEKVYDELDLKIALFIKEKRDEKWSMGAIFDELEKQFELRPFPEGEEGENLPVDVEVLKKQLTDEIKQAVREEFKEQIEAYRDYIETTIKERDKHLMQVLREIQETKKMIAAAEERKKEEQKKKKWWRFWN